MADGTTELGNPSRGSGCSAGHGTEDLSEGSAAAEQGTRPKAHPTVEPGNCPKAQLTVEPANCPKARWAVGPGKSLSRCWTRGVGTGRVNRGIASSAFKVNCRRHLRGTKMASRGEGRWFTGQSGRRRRREALQEPGVCLVSELLQLIKCMGNGAKTWWRLHL